MARRSTIPERGRIIYDWFNDPARVGQRFSREEWLRGTGFQNSATTNKALKFARSIAADNGQMIPFADDVNGHTYILTESPADAFDSTFAVSAMTHGMEVLQDKHLDFVAEHGYEGLSGPEADLMRARRAKRDARRAADEADALADAAIMAMRRAVKHNGQMP